jgi:hypothetical protein
MAVIWRPRRIWHAWKGAIGALHPSGGLGGQKMFAGDCRFRRSTGRPAWHLRFIHLHRQWLEGAVPQNCDIRPELAGTRIAAQELGGDISGHAIAKGPSWPEWQEEREHDPCLIHGVVWRNMAKDERTCRFAAHDHCGAMAHWMARTESVVLARRIVVHVCSKTRHRCRRQVVPEAESTETPRPVQVVVQGICDAPLRVRWRSSSGNMTLHHGTGVSGAYKRHRGCQRQGYDFI